MCACCEVVPTCAIYFDVDLSARLQLFVSLLSNNKVLQVLALEFAQCLRVIHIQMSPLPVWGLGDAYGCVAGL